MIFLYVLVFLGLGDWVLVIFELFRDIDVYLYICEKKEKQ